MHSERAIKRIFYGTPHSVWVESHPGANEITQREVTAIISDEITPSKYRAALKLDQENNRILISDVDFRFMLELCRRLKTARQIYWLLASGKSSSHADFTRRLASARLGEILAYGSPINIKVRSFNSRLYHEKMLQDMAYSYWQQQGFLASHDDEGQKIVCHLQANRLEIYLAVGGSALYKRGYRQSFKTPAPMREHLAHALISAALQSPLWQPSSPFRVDQVFLPFAGSGTLAFETLVYLLDIPIFIWQRKYAFETWKILPEKSDQHVKKQALARYQTTALLLPELILMDLSEKALAEVKANLQGFIAPLTPDTQEKLQSKTAVLHGDFFTDSFSFISPTKNLFIPLNPPYGQRLSQGKYTRLSFFAAVAQRLSEISKNHRAGLCGFCLLPDEASWSEFLRYLALPHHQTRHISLGGADMRVVFFHR